MTFHISWPGHDGRSYLFEAYPIGTAFHQIGGVYIFCKPSANGNWDALYVGETGNFDERLNTALQRHQAWPSCRFGGATHVCVKVIGGNFGKQQRISLETELRHSLRPPYNRQAA